MHAVWVWVGCLPWAFSNLTSTDRRAMGILASATASQHTSNLHPLQPAHLIHLIPSLRHICPRDRPSKSSTSDRPAPCPLLDEPPRRLECTAAGHTTQQ